MRALAWHGKKDVRVDTVPDPEIVNPHDAIIKVTSTAICGSDLHLYDGVIPTMQAETSRPRIHGRGRRGRQPRRPAEEGRPGRRALRHRLRQMLLLRAAAIFGLRQLQPGRLADMSELLYGYQMAGLFGYSHLTGGYAGGQAEYVRVPFADVGPIVVPDELEDDKVLFLSDILPTGWMAAENCEIEQGDTVAVWGCGPVGLFAIQSALSSAPTGSSPSTTIRTGSSLRERLGAVTMNFKDVDVHEALMEMTGGIGPDAVIDAVGMESHGFAPDNVIDRIEQAVMLETDRPSALRQAIVACRKGGRLSIPGVYGGFVDKFPLGALMEKGLTVRSGQTHVQKYLPKLLDMIRDGKIDTTFLISHRLPLEKAPEGYGNVLRRAERDDEGRPETLRSHHGE